LRRRRSICCRLTTGFRNPLARSHRRDHHPARGRRAALRGNTCSWRLTAIRHRMKAIRAWYCFMLKPAADSVHRARFVLARHDWKEKLSIAPHRGARFSNFLLYRFDRVVSISMEGAHRSTISLGGKV
jgi:hypothetical protein